MQMSELKPRARVLVVDDEDAARRALAKGLRLLGYQADEAASGAAALRTLAAQPYDALLLDLRMPGIDGVAVMQHTREHYADLIVIILTAYATTESAIAAVRAGASDYLIKPCSIRQVEATLARTLSEYLPRQSSPPPSPKTNIHSGPVTLDLETGNVTVDLPALAYHHQDTLTAHETALLAYLLARPQQICTCRTLVHAALDYHDLTEIEAQQIVRPHICRLRTKIEPPEPAPRLIQTIRGKGYSFSP